MCVCMYVCMWPNYIYYHYVPFVFCKLVNRGYAKHVDSGRKQKYTDSQAITAAQNTKTARQEDPKQPGRQNQPVRKQEQADRKPKQ